MKAIIAAVSSENQKSPRLFVEDRNTKTVFLADGGSDVSVLPKSMIGKPTGHIQYPLTAVNGSPIRTYGTCEMILQFGFPKEYRWNFIVAEVETPILGADFLKFYHLPIS